MRWQVSSHYSVIARKDYYANLDELKSKLVKGKDYCIVSKDRNSKVTIVAPHGGGIEAGTSELARAIAGEKYNSFDFFAKSLKARTFGHVTASHFREEKLSKILSKSLICVSIHRMRDRHFVLYLGGANLALKKLAAKELLKNGFQCTIDPPRTKGLSKKNFVNMASQPGLQIEIPQMLAKKLFLNLDNVYKSKDDYVLQSTQTKLFKDFVFAIDTALEEYLAKQN